VISALRGFSAPVGLTVDEPQDHAFARFRGDPDPFNRWEAAQAVAKRLILAPPDDAATTRFAEALQASLDDTKKPGQQLDAAFKALMLGLPTESDLAQAQSTNGIAIDPAFIHARRTAFKAEISRQLLPVLRDAYDALPIPNSFSPDPNFAGLRALRNALLDLMLAGNNSGKASTDTVNLAARHFATATNMTDRVGGLVALMHVQGVPYQDALDAFYKRFRTEPLVIDKWFSLQAGCPHPETLARVERLSHHPDFDPKTPNRWRALVQAFAANQSVFHGPDAGKGGGQGYGFLVAQVLMVDAFNPMTAARLIEPLSRFRFYAEPWRGAMRAALEQIARAPKLSRNTAELAGKALDDATG
jgi:aminopeptidase N